MSPNSIWKTVFFPYTSYVSLFLGMGLISGAIVHMPVSPGRYTAIMLTGVLLFGFASFVSDISKQENLTVQVIIRSVLYSLLLSVGIGMMSGGIQHFSDNVEYSALLIPAGFGVSLFSFILKNGIQLSVKRVYAVVLVFIMLVVPLRYTLTYIGDHAGVEDSHGHGH